MEPICRLRQSQGATLVLAATRSALLVPRHKAYHLSVHLPMVLAGTGLGLAGLLDIGPQVINVMQADELVGANPMFRLLAIKLPLLLVAAVYALVYHASAALHLRSHAGKA